MEKLSINILRNLSKSELVQVLEKVTARHRGGLSELSNIVSQVAPAKTESKILEQSAPSSPSLNGIDTCDISASPSKAKPKTKKRKQNRGFDISKYSQRHIALHVVYFGENYQGFARQDHSDNTIEYHLFRALSKTCLIGDLTEANYSRCGRTDKGVSALGQIISLTVRSGLKSFQLPSASSLAPKREAMVKQSKVEPETEHGLSGPSTDAASCFDNQEINYANVLNRALPDDIMVLGWAPSPDLIFKARFGAQTRTYRYFFVRREMDISKMRLAAKYLEGEHDFRNFCKIDVTNVKNFTRLINKVRIQPCNEDESPHPYQLYYIEVNGNAFLWHQIRCIAAVLFLVGRGLEEPVVIKHLLDVENNAGKPVYKLAEDTPLMLHESVYNNLQFYYDPQVIQGLYLKLERRWKIFVIKASLTKNVLNFIDSNIVTTGDENPWAKHKDRNVLECDYKDGCSTSFKSGYIPLRNRKKCSTYEEKVKNLSDRKREKANKIHGWDL